MIVVVCVIKQKTFSSPHPASPAPTPLKMYLTSPNPLAEKCLQYFLDYGIKGFQPMPPV